MMARRADNDISVLTKLIRSPMHNNNRKMQCIVGSLHSVFCMLQKCYRRLLALVFLGVLVAKCRRNLCVEELFNCIVAFEGWVQNYAH